MQQREVRVYLLDALAASEQIVSIRIVAVVEGDIDALVRDLQTRAH